MVVSVVPRLRSFPMYLASHDLLKARIFCTRRVPPLIRFTPLESQGQTILGGEQMSRTDSRVCWPMARYLKTFAVFVNMDMCELKDDYCGCVGAYCTGKNAQA
jgi:hypothetical protein